MARSMINDPVFNYEGFTPLDSTTTEVTTATTGTSTFSAKSESSGQFQNKTYHILSAAVALILGYLF